uniref:Protein kinase domain-containing protein n=1 Tax=Meloidogyne floridensis TaxID=298350 RepID=A0A915P4F9_9BILA
MCKCGKFSLEQLTETVELTGIDGNKMNLKYTTEFSAKIGAGAYKLFVLNFLNGVNVHERNHIIKMLGYGENDEKFFLAIELEEDNLRNYYGKIHRGKRKERSNVKVLNKIIKGAAKALAQFHKFGGHGDVKQENFVVSRDQDSNADVINVKLIDFNLSVLYGHDHDVNGIQKYDIKDFVIPTLHEINFDNNSKLDRIMKYKDEGLLPR